MKSFYKEIILLSFAVFFYSISLNAQCTPTGHVNFNNFGITNVTITGDGGSTINNNSGIRELYVDNTSISTNVTAGNTYNFSVTNGKETWGNVKMRFWIDYDGTGNYIEIYDSGTHTNNNNGTQTFNGSFTIDASAVTSSVVLRIAASYCDNCTTGAIMATDGCNFQGRAEIEDYTINITGGPIYCIPTNIQSNNTLYISEFNFNTINNTTTGNTGDYTDYTALAPATINAGQTYNGDVEVTLDTFNNINNTIAIWVDFNGNGSFEDSGELFLYNFQNTLGASTINVPFSFLVPNTAQIGNTVMRIGVRDGNATNFTSCDFDYVSGEIEDYSINIGEPPAPNIAILGSGEAINNGSTLTSAANLTDFGYTDVGFPLTHTFTIENTGSLDLTISSITLSNTTDFSIVGAPYSSPIAASGSSTFTIQYNAINNSFPSATVTVNNNDPQDSIYTFLITAESKQSFFDSDGDGIFDNLDLDDDNDGISDADEELACTNSNIEISTNYKFLNETFGEGTNRTTINTTYNALTTYSYEDGTGGNPGHDLNDGEYAVYYRAGNGDGINQTPNGDVSSWADTVWYTGEDHTPGDTDGRMAIFNASFDTGLFYSANITGSLPNVPISYSFWVLNLDTTTTYDVDNRLRPNILVEFRDVNGNLLSSITTGNIPPSINGDPENSWYNFSADLTFNVSEFNVFFYNNETGGLGNDLAIDDISIVQTLCDTDNDGIANIFDLDSDNDGIPDVVEAGYGNVSNGTALIDSWIDTNNNGMHDAAEGATILDSDGDGTPNYLDLDSDNDSIFDVDESGAGNSADPNFQNGDGDIDGDGVGDGTDTDYVREKDNDSNGISEYFADGILDIYDFYEGNTIATAYGNTNQGAGNTFYVLDTDGDGIPDYIDVYNNITGIYDISETLHAGLDTNSDGIIDDTIDNDKDGILDLFDTDDASFGSPRDLDRKLTLYFDGRNDFIRDEQIISAWPEITMMAWIKVDPTISGQSILFGQESFNLRLTATNQLLVIGSSKNLIYNTPLPYNQWVHVGASWSTNDQLTKLFVNGKEIASGTRAAGPLFANGTLFTLGKRAGADVQYYKGFMDEVRLFNKALSNDEIQKIVYQEIEQNGANIRGTEIPRDVTDFVDKNTITPLPWANLVRYYRLDNFKGDITDNLTTPTIDSGTGAKLYNIKQIEYQSAPMPFITQTSGSLETAVDIPAEGVNGDDAITYDWSIVRVEHNDVTFNSRQKHLGLFVEEQDANLNPIEFHVTNDSELNVSWYLSLDGFIDLEDESQLVQGEDSELKVNSIGKIERDQQGTADTYTYNYWSSPVKLQNSTLNTFRISDVLNDGTDPNNPVPINFITSGYNGSNGNPVGLADYWIWKFANRTSDDYSQWQHIRSTGNMIIGEGFTLKGPGTGSISSPQNYVFSGKPNNGDINLNINANNDYLVGNPYPSAIDANTFITDNGPELLFDNSPNPDSTPLISGTLYFWEHWGGGSHILAEYQGGYATYNFSGAVGAASIGTNDPDVATGGTPTKIPGRYIPVGQGFFVTGENSGTINFNNGQRIFQKENANSVFLRNSNSATSQGKTSTNETVDERLKFRIGFNSVNAIHRQLLLTIDENATTGVDWAYDGKLNESQIDDMFWIINDDQYIIQASDKSDVHQVFPIGIKTNSDGINSITIDALENVPNDIKIYLHDIDLNLYHNLRESDYDIFLNAGKYKDRFEITFGTANNVLGIEDNEIENLEVIYSSDIDKIVLINPNEIEIKSMSLYNLLGQKMSTYNDIIDSKHSEYGVKNVSAGAYFIKISTVNNIILSKKIIIE